MPPKNQGQVSNVVNLFDGKDGGRSSPIMERECKATLKRKMRVTMVEKRKSKVVLLLDSSENKVEQSNLVDEMGDDDKDFAIDNDNFDNKEEDVWSDSRRPISQKSSCKVRGCALSNTK